MNGLIAIFEGVIKIHTRVYANTDD